MAYKKMNRAADSGHYVVGSLRQYKDTVDENIAAKWRVKRPDEEPPKVGQLIDFMADDLSDSRVEMITDLENHLNETSGSLVDRVERDDAVRDLRYWYQFVRDCCLTIYSKEETQEMGFALVTEEHPWRLARQAERAINVFKNRDPEEKILPKDPKKAESALRAGYVVELLSSPHQRLVGVLEEVLSEDRTSEKAFLRKERSYKAFIEMFTVHAKCGEMLYRWAGLDKEAERIKPSTRRPGQREAAVEDPESDTQVTDAPQAPMAASEVEVSEVNVSEIKA